MSVWMIVVGIALLLTVAYDLLSTTLVTTTAAGPLTKRVATGLSSLARRVSRGPGSFLMQVTGPAVLLVTIGVWLLLLWGGWTLIFSADPDAVVSGTTGEPADGWSRLYFAGFTAFTLGVGDYVPNGAPWQVLTGLGVISGLAFTTLAITYLIPVVTAVTERRTQASSIAGLGTTPQQIVLSAWRNGSFDYLDHRLPKLGEDILLTAERHLSYPVLHFFHSARPHEDFAIQVLVLDEAVTLLDAGVEEGVGPHPAALSSVRHATTQLLQNMGVGASPRQEPVLLDLTPLRKAGVPTVDDDVFAERLEHHAEHRCRLAEFAEESLWHEERTYVR